MCAAHRKSRRQAERVTHWHRRARILTTTWTSNWSLQSKSLLSLWQKKPTSAAPFEAPPRLNSQPKQPKKTNWRYKKLPTSKLALNFPKTRAKNWASVRASNQSLRLKSSSQIKKASRPLTQSRAVPQFSRTASLKARDVFRSNRNSSLTSHWRQTRADRSIQTIMWGRHLGPGRPARLLHQKRGLMVNHPWRLERGAQPKRRLSLSIWSLFKRFLMSLCKRLRLQTRRPSGANNSHWKTVNCTPPLRLSPKNWNYFKILKRIAPVLSSNSKTLKTPALSSRLNWRRLQTARKLKWTRFTSTKKFY